MAYLGKVDMNDANIKHYSLTGSTLTTVDIGWVPPSEQSLRVTINGVVQQGDTFSYSGSNLTLGGPLVATDTLEVVGIESVGRILVPADDSVTADQTNFFHRDAFYENTQTITSNYTITASKNAMTAGDISVNSGVTVTVPTGARWVIV
tara:strand:- start:1626 stop:2072 length:447 start_codon:yes stop_codon:yes gene_type:complete